MTLPEDSVCLRLGKHDVRMRTLDSFWRSRMEREAPLAVDLDSDPETVAYTAAETRKGIKRAREVEEGHGIRVLREKCVDCSAGHAEALDVRVQRDKCEKAWHALDDMVREDTHMPPLSRERMNEDMRSLQLDILLMVTRSEARAVCQQLCRMALQMHTMCAGDSRALRKIIFIFSYN